MPASRRFLWLALALGSCGPREATAPGAAAPALAPSDPPAAPLPPPSGSASWATFAPGHPWKTLVSGADTIWGLAVDGDQLFWTTQQRAPADGPSPGAVWSMPKDGSAPPRKLADEPAVGEVMASGGRVAWTGVNVVKVLEAGRTAAIKMTDLGDCALGQGRLFCTSFTTSAVVEILPEKGTLKPLRMAAASLAADALSVVGASYDGSRLWGLGAPESAARELASAPGRGAPPAPPSRVVRRGKVLELGEIYVSTLLPIALAPDGIYWAAGGGIFAAGRDGSEAERLIETAGWIDALALDGQGLYWTERASVTGDCDQPGPPSGVVNGLRKQQGMETLASELVWPAHLALSDGVLYVADRCAGRVMALQLPPAPPAPLRSRIRRAK